MKIFYPIFYIPLYTPSIIISHILNYVLFFSILNLSFLFFEGKKKTVMINKL